MEIVVTPLDPNHFDRSDPSLNASNSFFGIADIVLVG